MDKRGFITMSNFEFLIEQPDYTMFAPAAIEAEKVYITSPAMCAIGCRKALELAVKWIYAADSTMKMPYKNNLQSLIHEQSFRFAVDAQVWGKLSYVIKLGNLAVHTQRIVMPSDAEEGLKILFEFIEWLDYSYGKNYMERKFDAALIPSVKVIVDTKKIKEQESLLEEKDSEIEKLQQHIKSMSAQFTAAKEQHQKERTFKPEDLSEFETRKRYIDMDLKEMGWVLNGAEADVIEEYEVQDMVDIPDQKGYVDYVLMGRDGLPLAIIEAKRTSKDPNVGRKQVMLYADCIYRKFGRRPIMFTTNGFQTNFWDDTSAPQRTVSGVFNKDDLQRLINRRSECKPLADVPINREISGRTYQMEAIRAVCDNIERGFRRHLLVMATGTGKTRTAAGLVDVLSRSGHVTNVLFLADRTALVDQAKGAFKDYLPDMSLCNLLSNKDDKNARIVFSTYPTMLNAIDSAKSDNGIRLFTPAHFDLIIVDESHRSIFKKYGDIFNYFDGMVLGLTATPKTDVDRNTYDFFEMESGVPTYAYDYETAVYTDHVLVPYYNYEVKTRFIEEGIDYTKLSDVDKERYENDFSEDEETIPKFIPSEAMNKFVFNEKTIDKVLQDLMERGIKCNGGDLVGKSIIFAQNKKHVELILNRFNKLYPHLKGTFAQRVICDDSYSQTVITEFKEPRKEPWIVISVDMMDTGIDVPECVNLVFFKGVRSKTKFWQMIGRGTRICPNLLCSDAIDGEYERKRRFLIFDYCGNFEFFREHKEGYENRETKTLSENIFSKKIRLAVCLQHSDYASDEEQAFRRELITCCQLQVAALNPDITSVKLKREYVEHFKVLSAYEYISEGDKGDLIKHIAPIVFMDESDEAAKRFDNFMFGLMLENIEAKSTFKNSKTILINVAETLEKRISIPQVKAKLDMIKSIQTDAFWEANDILLFEKVRSQLRDLIKFLIDENRRSPIITSLTDPVIDSKEGVSLEKAYDFDDYKRKVNRYVAEHGDTLAIHKLTHNLPLSQTDLSILEQVFTAELGSREDYKREFGDTPFGLLIRKIAKLDHVAAEHAFAYFINDQSLNQNQIAFVRKVINHVEQNGYMEDGEIVKPPFDRPTKFVTLFTQSQQQELIGIIRQIKRNALSTVS
jgi:type I restriction enzyme R subunit